MPLDCNRIPAPSVQPVPSTMSFMKNFTLSQTAAPLGRFLVGFGHKIGHQRSLLNTSFLERLQIMLHFRILFSIVLPLCVCAFLLGGAALAQENPQQETPQKKISKEYLEDLIQKGFAHREQIRSGQMVVTNNFTDSMGSVSRKLTIAFDENRRRVDRHNTFRDKNSYDDVGCIGCYKKDNQLVLGYSNYTYASRGEKKADDVVSRTAMTIYDVKQLEENELTKFWNDDFGFIPQYLAYFSTSRFPTKKTLEDAKRYFLMNTVGMFDMAEVTVTDEEYKGTTCKKIILETDLSKRNGKGITRNTLWIAEEQGYALRKHFFQSIGTLVSYEELLEIDVALDNYCGIWFPSAWHYERKDEGKLRTSQDGTVESVTLNRAIPESLFEMKDIKILPAGVSVQWTAEMVPPPYQGRLIWDGSDIIPRKGNAR